MKAIHSKVNIVPVIAKADTLTLRERDRLKRRVGFMCTHTLSNTHFWSIANYCFLCIHLSRTIVSWQRDMAGMSGKHLFAGCRERLKCVIL